MHKAAVTLLGNEASRELESQLEERIYQFNATATGYFDAELLGGSILDDEGTLVAGFSGYTWGACCELSYLWTEAGHRGRGLGTELLRCAEAEARRRGCRQILVSTHDFQAPGFYEARGYERKFALEDCPAGHRSIYYGKRLIQSACLSPNAIDNQT
jgi:GNAT superfamily N-acetyltransferase